MSARIVTTNCEKLVYLGHSARRRINYAREELGDDGKLLEGVEKKERIIQNGTSRRSNLSESVVGAVSNIKDLGMRATCGLKTLRDEIKSAPGTKSDELSGVGSTTSWEGIALPAIKEGRKKNFFWVFSDSNEERWEGGESSYS